MKRPLIFGEVLFDVFPDGEEKIGGAPFNVAYHLHHFGLNPLFISAVGEDSSGSRIIEFMRLKGMDTSGIQIIPQHKTGMVKVSIQNDEPAFDIVANCAYDKVEITDFIKKLDTDVFNIIYHGSLALRDPVSRRTLAFLLGKIDAPKFVDINLRYPWYDDLIIEGCCKSADYLKLNVKEFKILYHIQNIDNSDVIAEAWKLISKYYNKIMFVSLGGDGALAVDDSYEDTFYCPAMEANIVDTVGAGDALSASLIFGLLNNWDKSVMLERAIRFAGKICENQSALPSDDYLYEMK